VAAAASASVASTSPSSVASAPRSMIKELQAFKRRQVISSGFGTTEVSTDGVAAAAAKSVAFASPAAWTRPSGATVVKNPLRVGSERQIMYVANAEVVLLPSRDEEEDSKDEKESTEPKFRKQILLFWGSYLLAGGNLCVQNRF